MAKDITSKQAGSFQENDVNNPTTRTIRGKNLFPQSFQHPSTCRYGEVDPVMAFKCEAGDVVPYKFDTDLNTFTLASPLKSKVKMNSAAYKVPMQAIYPRNWERMFTNPVQGDDVPEDTRALFNVFTYASQLIDWIRYVYENSSNLPNAFNLYVRYVLSLEQVFSAGSLFSKFNMHLDQTRFSADDLDDPYARGTEMFFDEWFDTIFAPYLENRLTSIIGNYSIFKTDSDYIKYKVTSDAKLIGTGIGVMYISFRRALELLKTGEYSINPVITFGPDVSELLPFYNVTGYDPINIEPIIAYQLVCAHFFTNSKVDFIYSAQLFRENQQALYSSDLGLPTFIYNGVEYLYDVFSNHIFTQILENSNPGSSNDFFFNLFQFQRSLRYGDYFTGSRVAPIAVGDINTPIVDGSVNALDMTRKLQLTRYLNRVNINGPRFGDYLKGIFGVGLPDAPKDVPVKLSSEVMNIDGFEVNNTGSAQLDDDVQNITTTNLRLSGSKYMFEAHIDEPCWLLVVQYFDAHRIYSRTMDRFAFHQNRFDDFLPDLQFVGDQEVFTRELDFVNGAQQNFAYNLRYMEYKQRYSYASGGFINALKTWAFITDNRDGNPLPPTGDINPEYIRSSPSEFDRFYKSLTGYSMGTYFHFITFNTNVVAPYRQMVYAPEILA